MKIYLGKSDAIWSYVGVIMSMGANFMLLPFILLYLDNDSIGLYYIFISLGALTQLFDLGFNPAFARNVAYCWSGATTLNETGGAIVTENSTDFSLFRDVLEACKYVYKVISSISLSLILIFGIVYIRYITRDILGNQAEIAWFIFALALFLNLYFGFYAVFLRGVGAIAEINKVTVFARVFQILVTIALLVLGFGLIGTSIGYLSYGIIYRIQTKRKFFRFHRIGESLKSVVGKAERQSIHRIIRTIWYSAWRDGLVSVSTYLIGQAGTIVSSLYLTLEVTGIYSLSVQLTMAIALIAGTFHSMNQPVLQSAYITGDINKQRSVLSFNVVSFISLFVVGISLLVLVGIPIIRVIKPTYIVSIPVILAMGFYQFLLHFRNCYTTFLSTTNRVIYYKAFIVSAIICIVLEFTFTGYFAFGIWGLIWAQVFSQLMYNSWKWPRLVHQELSLSPRTMIKLSFSELKLLLSL